MFHNILVSTDGSADAEQAVTEAIDIARCARARLTILTAIDRPPVWAFSGLEAGAARTLACELEREATDALRRAERRVPQEVPVTTILSHEPICKVLLRRVTEGCHDVVVMGARGHGTGRSTVLGSVSRHIVHHSPVPVMVVHSKPAASKKHNDDDGVAGSDLAGAA